MTNWTEQMDLDVLRLGIRRAAQVTGVSQWSVRLRRRYLLDRDGNASGPQNKASIKWTPEDESLLGTDSNANVAARLGRTRNAVAMRMRRLGIHRKDPSLCCGTAVCVRCSEVFSTKCLGRKPQWCNRCAGQQRTIVSSLLKQRRQFQECFVVVREAFVGATKEAAECE